MRLKINLATEPYEDARHFLSVWGPIIGGLLALAVVLTVASVVKWRSYHQMSMNINRERSVLADLDNKQQQDLAILNRGENKDVRERSDFLNDLIKRKELSWTKIFVGLERMMPPRLHVISVEPKYVVDRLTVNLLVGGDSRERATELVRRIENSKSFRNAQFVSETQVQPGPSQEDPMRFAITAEYVPDADEAAQEQPQTTAAKSNGGGQ